MIHTPPPSPLQKLDIPQKGPLWRAWHRLKSKESRRRLVSKTLSYWEMSKPERLSRLRTLIDLGLWGDHEGKRGKKTLDDDLRMLGFDVLCTQRSGICTPPLFKLALEAGVDPNWCENNHYSDTFINLFARNDMHECLKVAIDAGGDISFRDSCGKTALHILLEHASISPDHRNKCLSTADYLFQHGCDINDPGKRDSNPDFRPPIFEAIDRYDGELVKWMLDRGASLDVKDSNGDTPLHCLASLQAAWTKQKWELLPLAELLLQNGARLDDPNRRGETPLWVSLAWRNPQTAQWLINQGADVSVVPHTYKDGRGYEFPQRKAQPLLQLLCEGITFSDDTIMLAASLAPRGMKDWNTQTSEGVALYEQLEKDGSPWLVAVQADVLAHTTQAVSQPPSMGRRPRL